jgi:hypothetical protein
VEEFLHSLILAIFFVLYLLLIPVILIIATPFILFWPGTRRGMNIKGRYMRILRVLRDIGTGFA